MYGVYGAPGNTFFPRFPNMLPVQPTFSGTRSSMGLTRFKEGLLKHLDRESGRANDATDIRTMTRRYGIVGFSATAKEFTVSVAEKTSDAMKATVRRVVSETLGGSYYGKPINVVESPARHLEIGAATQLP